ncbi:MAG TPA: hypothetical protein VK559_09295 [Ferruginibacter sp.]|nr:hypothetical protein [Ferruginibacter sp.]
MKQKLVKLILFFIGVPVLSFAQTDGYKYFCPLDSVKASGFYNIVLSPALNAYLKTDYSDLRVVNDSGKWVPHILRDPNSELGGEAVSAEMKIIQLQNSTVASTLIIENEQDTAISEFTVKFKTTIVKRFCTLTGSNDNKNWFIINDSILIDPTQIDRGSSQFTINFPACNYKYYKLVINNKGKDPFNIMAVYTPYLLSGPDPRYIVHPLVENPACRVAQKDSNKISYIKVTQNKAYHFGEISMAVSGIKYFYRTVDLYIPDSSNSSFANPGQLVTSFVISNNSSLRYFIKQTNAIVFYLLIHNEDNPPLKVDQVKTSSRYRVITTYLEKGNNYRLFLGNTTASYPDYDLSQLKFNRDSITTINTGKISSVEIAEKKESGLKNNNWWIWPCILAIIIALSLLTFKLSSELKNSEN